MSVRDKIAGFGGNGSTSNTSVGIKKDAPAWAPQQRYSKPAASSFRVEKPRSAGGSVNNGADAAVRKLRVPDAFKQGSETTEAELGVGKVASSSHDSRNGNGNGGVGSASRAPSGGLNGVGPAARSNPASGNFSSSRDARPVVPSKGGGSSTYPKRDILGVGSSNVTETSYSRFAAGNEASKTSTTARVINSSGSGGTGEEEIIRPRTSGKKQTGPRKLQVAGKGKSAISAEKQRAALGLDKDKNEETQAPASEPVTSSAPKRAGSFGTTAAATKTYTRPALAANTTSKASGAGVGGSSGGGGGGRGIPTTSSLRSSGHNLW